MSRQRLHHSLLRSLSLLLFLCCHCSCSQASGSPSSLVLQVERISYESAHFLWTPASKEDRINGYSFFYRPESVSDFEKIDLPGHQRNYHLLNLECGTVYEAYVISLSSNATEVESERIKFTTKEPEILVADKKTIIQEGIDFVTIDLEGWPSPGCPVSSIDHFEIEYRKVSSKDWTLVTRNFPATRIQIPSLALATWYLLRLTPVTTEGKSKVLEYKFATHSELGGLPVPPERVLITAGSTSVTVHTQEWNSVACPVKYYFVDFTTDPDAKWATVVHNYSRQNNDVVLDNLAADTAYWVRINVMDGCDGSLSQNFPISTLPLSSEVPFQKESIFTSRSSSITVHLNLWRTESVCSVFEWRVAYRPMLRDRQGSWSMGSRFPKGRVAGEVTVTDLSADTVYVINITAVSCAQTEAELQFEFTTLPAPSGIPERRAETTSEPKTTAALPTGAQQPISIQVNTNKATVHFEEQRLVACRVQKYRVEYTSLRDYTPQWTQVEQVTQEQELVIPNLTPATLYRVRVTAEWCAGPKTKEYEVSTLPPDAEWSRNDSFISYGSTFLTVHLLPDAVCPVQYWRVSCVTREEPHSTLFSDKHTNTSTLDITELTPNTSYSLHIAAITCGGETLDEYYFTTLPDATETTTQPESQIESPELQVTGTVTTHPEETETQTPNRGVRTTHELSLFLLFLSFWLIERVNG